MALQLTGAPGSAAAAGGASAPVKPQFHHFYHHRLPPRHHHHPSLLSKLAFWSVFSLSLLLAFLLLHLSTPPRVLLDDTLSPPDEAMKLKINKACDLASISVFPPRRNRGSVLLAGWRRVLLLGQRRRGRAALARQRWRRSGVLSGRWGWRRGVLSGRLWRRRLVLSGRWWRWRDVLSGRSWRRLGVLSGRWRRRRSVLPGRWWRRRGVLPGRWQLVALAFAVADLPGLPRRESPKPSSSLPRARSVNSLVLG